MAGDLHGSILEHLTRFYKTSAFVASIEKRQGLKVACLEEIAFNNDWINKVQLNKLKDKISNGPYKDYLIKILKK